MGRTVTEVLLKGLAGGVLVLVFAALAQMLKPKRFAGIFTAAPSVALAGLVMTVLFTSDRDLSTAGAGMAVGAVAFVVYCLTAVPLIRRFGAWPGSVGALAAWGVVSTAGFVLVLA